MLKVNPYSGLFVAIEGLDGSGVSTQVKLLAKGLRRDGFSVFATKEPTDNIVGGLIRGVLSGVYQLNPAALQLLFVADRLHHLQREIIPILTNSNIIIADRYLWSTIAFGSVGLSKSWLLRLHHYCFLPDLSVFLKVPPRICIKRLKADRFDFELFEEEQKLVRAWRGYERCAKKFPENIIIVDGQRKPMVISSEILKIIKKQPKFKLLKNSLKTVGEN